MKHLSTKILLSQLITVSLVPTVMSRPLKEIDESFDRNIHRDPREQKELELRNNSYVMAINSPKISASENQTVWDTFKTSTPSKVDYMETGITVALNFYSDTSSRNTNHDSKFENEISQKQIQIVTAGIFDSQDAIEGLIERLRSGRYRLNIFLKTAPLINEKSEIAIISAKNIQRVELQDLLDNVVVWKKLIK